MFYNLVEKYVIKVISVKEGMMWLYGVVVFFWSLLKVFFDYIDDGVLGYD